MLLLLIHQYAELIKRLEYFEVQRQMVHPFFPAHPEIHQLPHRRFVLPAACLVFALTGLPLGMQNRRSGKSGGFALALGVIISYFVLLSLGRNLGEQEILPPIIALWIPNATFLIIGLLAFWLAATERPFPLIDRLQHLPTLAVARLKRRSSQ